MTPLARLLIDRVADRSSTPRYGSPAWDALPDQDPRRAASITVAAEAWRRHCSPEQVAADLLAEMAHSDLDMARRIRETAWDVHAALHPAMWDINGPIPGEPRQPSPSYAELAQRRAA